MRRLLATLVLAACSQADPAIRARLVDPDTIEIAWPRLAAGGGAWLEVATPGDDFVMLDAVWPDVTTYRHDRVAPGTTFVYRLRPFAGPVSRTVVMTTGRALTDEAPRPEGPLEGEVPRDTPGSPLRSRPAAAAPADLTAALSSATSVELRWRDRASDEDGYLVEMSADGRAFAVRALLPPDASSFRAILLPAEATLYVRVRAFGYGAATRGVSVTTPVTIARDQR